FDSLTGVMRFADHTVQLDQFEVWGPLLYALADGGLGLDAAHPGTLVFEAFVDSLGTIESLLRDRFSAFNRDSLVTRVAGGLRVDATISGSLDAFEASGTLDVPSASSSGGAIEGLDLKVTWPTAANGRMTIDGKLDSLTVGRYAYSDLALDLHGRRNEATWQARARIGLDGEEEVGLPFVAALPWNSHQLLDQLNSSLEVGFGDTGHSKNCTRGRQSVKCKLAALS
ncbi:MAG: hypothetical protein IH987_15670, partial [Planctomycetes bacterium]|nr:hypothetical protein [Planctomycetota bacterium]